MKGWKKCPNGFFHSPHHENFGHEWITQNFIENEIWSWRVKNIAKNSIQVLSQFCSLCSNLLKTFKKFFVNHFTNIPSIRMYLILTKVRSCSQEVVNLNMNTNKPLSANSYTPHESIYLFKVEIHRHIASGYASLLKSFHLHSSSTHKLNKIPVFIFERY